jgi:hypothetical protein
MSKELESGLSDRLREVLDGTAPGDRVGETFLLLTVSEDGWAHVALLSVGEIVATSTRELRLALWRNTTTGTNLKRSGRATLVAIIDGAAYYSKLAVDHVGQLDTGHESLEAYRAAVEQTLVDRVGYAELIGGIRFRLPNEEAVVRRWEETVGALLKLP